MALDDGIRHRFAQLLENKGIPWKTASRLPQPPFGETYVRDVIERQRGKVDAIEKIVEAIDPLYVEWVLKGRGQPPSKEGVKPAGLLVYRAPESGATWPGSGGTREEGISYQVAGDHGHPHKELIERLLRERPNAYAKIMKSDVLALQGVRPGDVMIFDRSVPARNGDIVCAQVLEGDSAKTVFRLYQPPNLVAASFDPSSIRPEVVDDERVQIAGVMTDLLRRRS